jgi:hypothetical protein
VTTKKKKAPTSTPARVVNLRVRWNPQDYARLLRIEPRLADPALHNLDSLVYLLREAQKQLPRHRQMTLTSVRQRIVRSMDKVIAAIQAAAPKLEQTSTLSERPSQTVAPTREAEKAVEGTTQETQIAQVAQEANVEQAEQVAAQAEPETTESGKSPRILVRWDDREHSLIAHEVSALLRKDSKHTNLDLIDAVMRAQAKVLPRERWRPRSGISQACYKNGRVKLIERLREGMKTQAGLHVPPVVPTVPEPETVGYAAPAPAPTSEPPVSAAAPAVSGASGIEEAIVALVRKVVREGMPILAQAVAEHAVALLRGDLLSDIDKTVRKGVTDVVGGPSEAPQAAQPQPAASLSVVPPAAKPQAPEKQRVDIIGLLGAQANVVRSAMGKAFDLRFVTSDFAEHQRSVAPIVVLCTKFVNHSAQEKARSRGAHVLFANGAAQSVIEQLQHLQTKQPHDLHASARA